MFTGEYAEGGRRRNQVHELHVTPREVALLRKRTLNGRITVLNLEERSETEVDGFLTVFPISKTNFKDNGGSVGYLLSEQEYAELRKMEVGQMKMRRKGGIKLIIHKYARALL